ncbi:MAG: hypothetical protein KGO83_02220 [Paenibacillaceae bacterium]|jgi:hypothetical protein|nr:hypothetical protein [Paenibacillaceae bacterium]
MDRDFVNRNTLLLSLRAVSEQIIVPEGTLPNPSGKPLDPLLARHGKHKERGIAPVPGVFVTWKGTEQTIYEVQGLCTWTLTVPTHTTKHCLLAQLPHCVAIKSTKNCVVRPMNQRGIGSIARMPIHWHTKDVSMDHEHAFHMIGTCDALPYVSGQTLHVVAYVHVVPMAQYIASLEEEDYCSSSAG